MAVNEEMILGQVDALISSVDEELSEERRLQIIEGAIERFGIDRPDQVTDDFSGDAGRYYPITTNLTSFTEGLSTVLSVEYPAATIASDETPVYLTADDWDDNYWQGGTRYLFFPNHSPAATETVRVRYTAAYVKSDGAYNINSGDFHMVCLLAASMVCQAIATKYSRTVDSVISADSVDHITRGQEFSRRAKEYMNLYLEQIGLKSPGNGGKEAGEFPSGEFVDWDTHPPNNRRWLAHRNR